jgi:DNA mismatch endonuclease (patch repair protein)
MSDIMTSEQRSENMRRICSTNTQPEMKVRRLIHRMGYRYRIHVKKLPGTPDIVFSARRKIIFVHGCFWHFHQDCRGGRIPQSKIEYWKPKLLRTRERDEAHRKALVELGWDVLVIWECDLREISELEARLKEFLH